MKLVQKCLFKNLTQLAIDTSSLYNIDVEDTVSKFYKVLSGQTKPVQEDWAILHNLHYN